VLFHLSGFYFDVSHVPGGERDGKCKIGGKALNLGGKDSQGGWRAGALTPAAQG
jgi:hypothetical protein